MLNREEWADEHLLMGLRLAEGLDTVRHAEIAGRELRGDAIEFLERIGLLERIGNRRIRATAAGFLVLDAVVADLASEVPAGDLATD